MYFKQMLREALVRLENPDTNTDPRSARSLLTRFVRYVPNDSLKTHAKAVIEYLDGDNLSFAKTTLTNLIEGFDSRSTLHAGDAEGAWYGHCDIDGGVSLCDNTDPHNEPAAISVRQSRRLVYKRALAVWPQVCEAKTMHEACAILRAAGIRLHRYCRMD